ncbi:MAG: methyltransferase domain-containing protein [Acidimicrobiales bacterium]
MSVTEPPDDRRGIDYQRLYAYRFRDVDQVRRQAIWDELTPVLSRWLGSPRRVLDPAAGRGEFVNASDAEERWVVDSVEYDETVRDPEVNVVIGDARFVALPEAHFDGVFVSNLLEHLATQDDVARFLRRMRQCMSPSGRIAVLGPNFRYCHREYFDCADHTLALTHIAVAEHLYSAGFEIERVVPRFIPYSFRSRLPQAPWLVRLYLRVPMAWRVLGRQFLIVAIKPADSASA